MGKASSFLRCGCEAILVQSPTIFKQMKAGIIAEGKSDAAVLTNLLKGKLDIQRSDIQYLLPELEYDETDLSNMRPEQFSTWSVVRQKCMDNLFLNRFFETLDDERFLTVHLDAAERMEINYEVIEPPKHNLPGYVEAVRQNIVAKVLEWMQGQYGDRVVLAVAVEETDGAGLFKRLGSLRIYR